MGQQEVMNILKKAEKPLSVSQIAERLGENTINVSKTVRRILKGKDIECIELDRHESARLLGWPNPIRRTRFYYVRVD